MRPSGNVDVSCRKVLPKQGMLLRVQQPKTFQHVRVLSSTLDFSASVIPAQAGIRIATLVARLRGKDMLSQF